MNRWYMSVLQNKSKVVWFEILVEPDSLNPLLFQRFACNVIAAGIAFGSCSDTWWLLIIVGNFGWLPRSKCLNTFPVCSLNDSLDDISGWVSLEQKFVCFNWKDRCDYTRFQNILFWSRWTNFSSRFSHQQSRYRVDISRSLFYVICCVRNILIVT